MLKNYFKIAWRNLLKNKVTAVINIGGLSIGLAVAIVIMLWAVDEYNYDKFHAKLPNIYMMMENAKQGGEFTTYQSVPAALAPALKLEIPEVKYAARVSYPGQQLIKTGDKSLYESGIYAEPEYFTIMTFPAISGDPVATLKEPGSIVITESTAKKLFGNADPIGKIIIHNNLHNLKVGAVIKDVPSNSNFKFDAVLPFSMYEKDNADGLTKWDYNSLMTWVELKPGADIEKLNKKLSALIQSKKNDLTVELFAYPLAQLGMHGQFKNGKPNGGRIEMIMMLTILGLFVLLVACINFMNLSTARSEHRAREVGVRKSLGASKKSLVLQFLSEAFLMTFIALLFSVLIAKLILPGFNNLTEKNVSFDISNWKIWGCLILTGMITALLSGSYPAFFLSRFQPVKVLKGTITSPKGGSLLRRGLVTFQFVISVFLIIVTIVVYKQVQHAQARPVGYSQENLIELPARGDMADKFQLLKTELMQLPAVKNISAGSDDITGFGSTVNGFEWPGKTADQDFNFSVTRVQYDWAKTIGLKITEGRDFSINYGSDSTACLVNETAVKKMGLKEPVVGTVIDNHTIVGVVGDFIFNDAFSSPQPLVAYLNTGSMSHFFIRLKDKEKWQSSVSSIEKSVKKINPGYPFEFHLTEEEFQHKFRGIKSGGQFSSIVGVLAIIISCLGLFALSAFVAERRTKEIGVRKVLGATVGDLWFTLSKDFLKPVFLAIIIAVPLGGFAMQKMLLSMEYHIQLSWWMFVLAGVLAITIAIITVSFQGIKAAVANPVKSLRSE